MNQIEWIHTLQSFDPPWFVAFMRFINYFDKFEFYFAFIPLVWLGLGRRFGMKLFYFLFISSLINPGLKYLFNSPRPCHVDPSLALVPITGLGFPSGAGETSTLIALAIIVYWKSPWRWPIAGAYWAIVSFSRVYLRVHYPTDVLGGWGFGALIFLICYYLFPIVQRAISKISLLKLLIALSTLLITAVILFPHPHLIKITATLIGLQLSYYLIDTFHLDPTFATPIIRMCMLAPIIILGAYGLFSLFESSLTHLSILHFIQYFCIALWIGMGSSILAKPLNRH